MLNNNLGCRSSSSEPDSPQLNLTHNSPSPVQKNEEAPRNVSEVNKLCEHELIVEDILNRLEAETKAAENSKEPESSEASEHSVKQVAEKRKKKSSGRTAFPQSSFLEKFKNLKRSEKKVRVILDPSAKARIETLIEAELKRRSRLFGLIPPDTIAKSPPHSASSSGPSFRKVVKKPRLKTRREEEEEEEAERIDLRDKIRTESAHCKDKSPDKNNDLRSKLKRLRKDASFDRTSGSPERKRSSKTEEGKKRRSRDSGESLSKEKLRSPRKVEESSKHQKTRKILIESEETKKRKVVDSPKHKKSSPSKKTPKKSRKVVEEVPKSLSYDDWELEEDEMKRSFDSKPTESVPAAVEQEPKLEEVAESAAPVKKKVFDDYHRTGTGKISITLNKQSKAQKKLAELKKEDFPETADDFKVVDCIDARGDIDFRKAPADVSLWKRLQSKSKLQRKSSAKAKEEFEAADAILSPSRRVVTDEKESKAGHLPSSSKLGSPPLVNGPKPQIWTPENNPVGSYIGKRIAIVTPLSLPDTSRPPPPIRPRGEDPFRGNPPRHPRIAAPSPPPTDHRTRILDPNEYGPSLPPEMIPLPGSYVGSCEGGTPSGSGRSILPASSHHIHIHEHEHVHHHVHHSSSRFPPRKPSRLLGERSGRRSVRNELDEPGDEAEQLRQQLLSRKNRRHTEQAHSDGEIVDEPPTKASRSSLMRNRSFIRPQNSSAPGLSQEMYDKLDRKTRKMLERNEFTYFFTKKYPFSNHYRCPNLKIDGMDFTCTEQYYMYRKALQFNDNEAATEILEQDDPKEMKNIGRFVEGFVQEEWDAESEEVMMKASEAKYTQNEELLKYLFETRDTILVETNPSDFRWGIGLSMDDHRAWDHSTWRGDNLLGFILTRLRDKLLKNPKYQQFHVPPFKRNFEAASRRYRE